MMMLIARKPGAMVALILWFWACLAATESLTPLTLTADLGRVEAVRDVKNLQRTYARLLQYGLWPELAALFDDKGSLSWVLSPSEDGADTIVSQATGPKEIEEWFRDNAGTMGNINSNPTRVLINDMPVVSLSGDGQAAKVRWAVMSMTEAGAGEKTMESGVFENEYVRSSTTWKISLLRYYPLYRGNFTESWTGADLSGSSPVAQPHHHFTPGEAGAPIMLGKQPLSPNPTDSSRPIEDLAYRVSQLNEEDTVRNLVHAMGYYIDRRMWIDVVALFTANGTVTTDGISSAPGPAGIRTWLETTMGPENLTRGVFNDHPIYNTHIQLSPDILTATARGLELAVTVNTTTSTPPPHPHHQFLAFQHTLTRDASTGTWKIHNLNYTRLTPNSTRSRFPSPLDKTTTTRHSHPPPSWRPLHRTSASNSTNDGYNLETLHRLLARSAAYDETENVSGAYGFYNMMGSRGLQGEGCKSVAGLFARDGVGMVRGVGWVRGVDKVEEACTNTAGAGALSDGGGEGSAGGGDGGGLAGRDTVHWRVQLVILVSQDGAAATVRARMAMMGDGFGSGGGVYHDQVVLESAEGGLGDGLVGRKLWCVSLDEYRQGDGSEASEGGNTTAAFTPDVSLRDPLLGECEVGFLGGPGTPVAWPDIRRMWWEYRNPVTGAVPGSYWAPGCVPCRGARQDWALADNGYQEPTTGSTSVKAMANGSTMGISVSGGPEEFVWGVVELHAPGPITNFLASAILDGDGNAELEIPTGSLQGKGTTILVVYYLGNDRLEPGRTTVDITGPV